MSAELEPNYLELEQKNPYYKVLSLISPEAAQSRGINAESPVFVSPFAQKGFCPHCHTEFSPILYQAGYEVASQHNHEDRGGIYFYFGDNKDDGAIGQISGWMAEVEPQGTIYEGPDFLRADSVKVLRIRAFCVSSAPGIKYNVTVRHETTSGIAIPRIKAELTPRCTSHLTNIPSIGPGTSNWGFEIDSSGYVGFFPTDFEFGEMAAQPQSA